MIDARVLKNLAVACLALSIGAIAYSLHATWQAGNVLGPGALVVTPQHEVWLAVDDELWRADADGRLKLTQDWTALGLPGAPANLVRHPQGAIVATLRDDATLYILDAASAHVVRTLKPRWPADLARDGGRAINLAFHDDGRIAIATGGGHCVALFSADGEFLARTAPDTYRFSNGLWWVGDALWTTDTNRFLLKRLDAATLELRQSVALPAYPAARYLGMARAHPRAAAAGTMAALVRFENGMIDGRVVAIDSQGGESAYPHEGRFEPRDLDWLDGDLLASDGATFSVRRWSATGEPLPAFGDDALRSRLLQRLTLRSGLQREHRIAIAAAIVAFAIAGVFVLLGQRAQRRQRAPLDLSQLGTPRVATRRMLQLQLQAGAPLLWLALLIVILRLRWVTDALQRIAGARGLIVLLIAVLVAAIVALPLFVRRLKRLARADEYEPAFNLLAMHKLRSSAALPSALREGEQVRETFMLQRSTPRWAVLTDERLLLFKANLFDDRLELDVPLGQIVSASAEPGSLTPGRRRGLLARGLAPFGWIEICLRDGRMLAGGVPSGALARRLAQRLVQHAPVRQRAEASAAARPTVSALSTWASAVVPGLGQWIQGRGRSALLMFVPWLGVTLFVTLPVAWTVAGPRADVSWRMIALVASFHVVCALSSAWDAWRMSPAANAR